MPWLVATLVDLHLLWSTILDLAFGQVHLKCFDHSIHLSEHEVLLGFSLAELLLIIGKIILDHRGSFGLELNLSVLNVPLPALDQFFGFGLHLLQPGILISNCGRVVDYLVLELTFGEVDLGLETIFQVCLAVIVTPGLHD